MNIEIPESVVEAIRSSYALDRASIGEMIDKTVFGDRLLRTILQIGLAEMLEPVGFTNSEEYVELKAGRGGWVSGLELDGDTITLYRIRGQ